MTMQAQLERITRAQIRRTWKEAISEAQRLFPLAETMRRRGQNISSIIDLSQRIMQDIEDGSDGDFGEALEYLISVRDLRMSIERILEESSHE